MSTESRKSLVIALSLVAAGCTNPQVDKVEPDQTSVPSEPSSAKRTSVDVDASAVDAGAPDASGGGGTAPDAGAGDISLLPEPLGNPRLRFADGGVAANRPSLFPGSPVIAGFAQSSWFVAQWKKTTYMRPDSMFANSPHAADPMLGTSRWAFPTSDNQSHLWIWEPAGGPRVFELYGEHGWLDAAGGANVFLSADAVDEAFTVMDRPVRLQLAGKVARSNVSYAAPGAGTDGSVVWQVITGLVVHFVPPGGGKRTNLFLQINHADSRDQYGPYLQYGTSALYGYRLPGTPSFQGDRPTGALIPLDIDVNAYLCDAAKRSYAGPNGTPFNFPVEARNLANWRLKGLYTGIETQDRQGSATAAPRGASSVAYQVAGVDVRKQPSAPVVACP